MTLKAKNLRSHTHTHTTSLICFSQLRLLRDVWLRRKTLLCVRSCCTELCNDSFRFSFVWGGGGVQNPVETPRGEFHGTLDSSLRSKWILSLPRCADRYGIVFFVQTKRVTGFCRVDHQPGTCAACCMLRTLAFQNANVVGRRRLFYF